MTSKTPLFHSFIAFCPNIRARVNFLTKLEKNGISLKSLWKRFKDAVFAQNSTIFDNDEIVWNQGVW